MSFEKKYAGLKKISLSKIHIIAFDVPFPADYGGVIDIFYKIRALKKNNVKVILHCFEYGRKMSRMLNEECHKVFYYPRRLGFLYNIDSRPYIVSTRFSEDMKNNLNRDNYPVLFEGLHTTACLRSIKGNNRKLVVRTHNIEHDYYRGLMKADKNIFRKIYFYSEAFKLKRYEKILKVATGVAAISRADYTYFSKLYKNVNYIPAFHPYDEVNIQTGHGEYALFHGNLSVAENEKAALYLIERVFKNIDYPFVIAGKDPGSEIIKAAEINNHIKVVSDPDEREMDLLVRNAHINVLVTFQSTGIKLKLLASLFSGRHCLVNSLMVENTGLSDLCHIADSEEEFISKINILKNIDFSSDTIIERRNLLDNELSNVKNAQKLASMLL